MNQEPYRSASVLIAGDNFGRPTLFLLIEDVQEIVWKSRFSMIFDACRVTFCPVLPMFLAMFRLRVVSRTRARSPCEALSRRAERGPGR